MPIYDILDDIPTETEVEFEKEYINNENKYLVLSPHVFYIVASTPAGDALMSREYDNIEDCVKMLPFYRGIMLELEDDDECGTIVVIEKCPGCGEENVVDYDFV